MANVSRGWQQQQGQRPERYDRDAQLRNDRTAPQPRAAHRLERMSRDTLGAMETQPLRDALRNIDAQIGTGIAPRGVTMQELETEWCYIRRELEFRGGRRDQ